jgi:hypothetical protein
VDNLIGMSSPDPYSQPTHRRSLSNASSPSTSILAPPARDPRAPQSHGVPIPRPPSQIHRPMNNNPSEGNTPLSHSPSSSDSPFPFSPINSTNPASFLSTNTGVTTPPSSASLNSNHIQRPQYVPYRIPPFRLPPSRPRSVLRQFRITYHVKTHHSHLSNLSADVILRTDEEVLIVESRNPEAFSVSATAGGQAWREGGG